jgi:glycine betaine catabolism B
MLRWIDDQLNRVTMYRLVLFYLIVLLGAAVVLSFTHLLAYDPFALLFSIAFLLAVCALTNFVFARTFGVPANVESTYISALILALIITPIQGYVDLWFLGWAAVLSMASKYILAIRGKHLFNPVALAVALTYFAINQSASWWVGSAQMLPFVLIGGLLVARKIRRFDLVLSFLAATLAGSLLGALFSGTGLIASFSGLLLYSPFLFFAFVMITEPLTSPPTRALRVVYGVLVGLLFSPAFHIGTFYITPELALLSGNVFSYLVSPKTKLVLRLKSKQQIAPNAYEFVFAPSRKLAFSPGQYMEWTLGHEDPDSRGNRRYFTLASAPTEADLRLGVRFNNPSSSFKKAMLAMGVGAESDEIVAAQVMGDFVLPADPKAKCVFIAGGIGITPFRSMLQYLLDKQERRPIVLFYANHSVKDIVYKDVLDRAERELGIRTIYTVSDKKGMPPGWVGLVGHMTSKWIQSYAPEYGESIFYLSGPMRMIDDYKRLLHQMGIPDAQIKMDFFAGL